MRFFLLACTGLVVGSLAAPSTNYVLHEKRNRIPPGWRQTEKLEATDVLPIRIALTQSNLDRTNEYLMQVSHPESDTYGQHWSAKSIAETFAPAQEAVDLVTAWLVSEGVQLERILRSQSLGWLVFNATVDEAQNLLKAEYYRYRHSSGKPHVGCAEYHVPEHVSVHIDLIIPTVAFDAHVVRSKNEHARTIRSVNLKGALEPRVALKSRAPNLAPLPKSGPFFNISTPLDGLRNCRDFTTPDCLRALYRIPPGTSANPNNTYGIVEYTPQSYLQGDLDLFFANFSINQVQRTPTLASIDGGTVATTILMVGYDSIMESDLDLEYGMALVNPQNTTLYQVGDSIESPSFNNFLDAIDGSYCTFEGGDDPNKDASYPDPSGGYQGPQNCGGFAATKVISVSYGYNELDLSARYQIRQCAEYAKLGLAGTTLLYASGDHGVAGIYGECIDASNKTSNSSAGGVFSPAFPPSCPYITAVGATQIKHNGSVTDPEVAAEDVFKSGGGFSNVFGLPSYQVEAVKSWFSAQNASYEADRFNNSRTSRGYPDISANGVNYVVAVDNAFIQAFGTSASAPVVGAIFTLINEARINAGKSSIGFVNPVLYSNPGALNDVTSGNNPGCGTPGFSATKGWDPVTGLGTPNYAKLLDVFMALN